MKLFVFPISAMHSHAIFYATSADDIAAGFRLEARRPVIYMVAEDGKSLLEYQGEILDMNLGQWVLKNTSPGVSELSIASPNGDKFLLFSLIF